VGPRRVDATSKAASRAINDLLDVAIASGIELHSALEVRERNGQVSLHASVPEGETLIRLPEGLLVPLGKATWDVSGDALRVVQHDSSANAVQRELADAHVALYNATAKIRWAKRALPRVALSSDPAAIDAIRLLRPKFATRSADVAQAFLDTRVNREGHLLPVVDLLDHHPGVAPLQVVDGGMTIPAEHGGAGTKCFASYGSHFDAVDLVFGYGYVDHGTRFVRSVPVSVDVAGVGTVSVLVERTTPVSGLDPPRVSMSADQLVLSHLTFELGHVDRLVTVVHLAVAAFLNRQTSATSEPAALSREVVAGLVDANIEIVSRVETALAGSSSEAAQAVSAACRHQGRILDQIRHEGMLASGHSSTTTVESRRNR
jgi:hypothetical protein